MVIEVLTDDLLQWYLPLDETSGTTANDLSAMARNATLKGDCTFDANSVAGQYGGALEFDGIDDSVVADSYAGIIGTQARTVSAWIKTTSTGAIVYWGQFGTAGSKFTFRVQEDNGTAGAIRLEVNGGYIVGSTDVRDGQWHHVAVVVPETTGPNVNETLLYVDGQRESVSASSSRLINTLGGSNVQIGRDGTNRCFSGMIDDVRIYCEAMSQAEIQSLMAGGTAETPYPFDGATAVSNGLLSWAPSAAAISSEIYIGTDQAAVSAATTASPEYQGTAAGSGYIYNALLPATTYYWRVDSVTASGTITGSVWTFTSGLQVGVDTVYFEQKSSGNGRLKTTGSDVELAPAGTTGSTVEWQLIPAGNGAFYIQNVSDGGLVRAVDTLTVDLAASDVLNASTQWKLVTYTGDWMFIVSVANGQKLHRSTGVLVNLAPPYYTGDNMQWRMVETPDSVPPAAPAGLASATDGSTPPAGPVELNWDDNGEDDLAGYRIYRAISESGPFTMIANNIIPSHFDDYNVVQGEVYFYYVTAFDDFQNTSGQSAPAYVSLRIQGDLDGNNAVTLMDFAIFAQSWLAADCWYCNGADLSGDEQVNFDDLRILSENWLTE